MPQLASARWIACLLLLQSAILLAGTLGGVPGKDGPNAALTGTVNTYFPGTSATASGTTGITLGTARGAATAIAVGDLLLIIQMQDATIDATNTADYGDGTGGSTGSGATSNGQSGLYEYIVATSAVAVTGGTLNFTGTGTGGGLINAYSNAAATATRGQRRYQIVRVPQYSSATMTGTVTAAAWDGTSGGIVALDIAGTLTFGGQTVSVAGLGFRGGGARQLGGTAAAGFADTDYRAVSWGGTEGTHGSKGEGTAGTPRYVYTAAGVITDLTTEGYPNGSFGRGAPGNAGGGGSDGNVTGNDQNSGGGGGGNGAAGGKGGNCWNSQEPYGGYGGALFAASPARMVLGGGGGAGTRNNSAGVQSSGGPGGGMIFIQCNAVSGTGTLNVDGAAGVNADNDGAGGGGAAGSVLFFCNSNITNLTINARGGDGGDSWPSQNPGGTPGDRHGPGGGGGGGVVYRSAGTVTTNVTAGGTGTTTNDGSSFGATAGTTSTNTLATLNPSQIPGAVGGYGVVPVLTIVKTTSTSYVEKIANTATSATYTITVSNQSNRASATSVSLSDDLVGGNSGTARFTFGSIVSVVFTGGASGPTSPTNTGTANIPIWGTYAIPGGGSVALTFIATVGSTMTNQVVQNPATASYLDPQRTTTTGTATVSYSSASSTGEDVTLLDAFTITASNLSTVDSDGDGKLDAIRVTCAAGLTLNDNFSALNITVAGYTVTGYATDLLAGGANDNVFYVLLQVKTFDLVNGPWGDTGARPAVQVVSNNSLIETGGTATILDTTAALTPADGAQPVLIACDWSDGSGGGVSATDFLYLRMSEPVTATNVAITHLALPVTSDTLDATSLVQNVTNSSTITVQLLGNPLFTPGGVYAVGSLAAGSPSGILINNGTNIRDAANLAALNQTFGTAVDIRPGNVVVAIAWPDLTNANKVWNLNAQFGTAYTASSAFPPNTLEVRNVGNVRVTLNVVCTPAATPGNWQIASTSAVDRYEMKLLDGALVKDLVTSQVLTTSMYSGQQKPFDLRFVAPSDITNESTLDAPQSIIVTIIATQN